MAWPSSSGLISSNVVMLPHIAGCGLSVGVRAGPRGGTPPRGQEAGVGRRVAELHEELGHLGLPPGVHVGGRHARAGRPPGRVSRSSRSAARRPAGTASSCASRSRASASSIVGQTAACRCGTPRSVGLDLELEADALHAAFLRWVGRRSGRFGGRACRDRGRSRQLDKRGQLASEVGSTRGRLRSRSRRCCSASNTVGSPSSTTPSAPTVNSPSSPASKVSPSSP